MRDYREALLADMKAIGKFCLRWGCSVTLQVFKGEMCKNTSIPNRNFLHYIRFNGDCNTN